MIEHINWAAKVNSVAVSAGRAPKLIDLEGDYEYYAAIGSVVEFATRAQSSYLEKMRGRLLMKLPGAQKALVNVFTEAAFLDKNGTLDGITAKFQKVAEVSLPAVIDKLAEQPGESNQEDMQEVSKALREGDQMLRLKFLLDSHRYFTTKLGLNSFIGATFLSKLAAKSLPGYANPQPENLTREFIEKIDNYGLGEYVYLDYFLTGISEVDRVGKAFSTEALFRPSINEVTSVSYEQREENWREGQANYRTKRAEIAQRLGEYMDAGVLDLDALFNKINREWLRQNTNEAVTFITETLSHPMTRAIIDFSKDSRFRSSLGKPLPNFSAIATAMINVAGYRENNTSELRDTMLGQVTDRFITFVIGLYGLEVGRNRYNPSSSDSNKSLLN